MKLKLKKYIPSFIYLPLRNWYLKSKYRKLRPGANKASLLHNENIFQSLDFSCEAVKKELTQHGLCYENDSLSWHYHIFAGWSDFCKRNDKKVLKILEIGTYNGHFTNYLASLFNEAQIYTIDLPEDDEQFISTYSRDTLEKRGKFLSERKQNLEPSNISFYEMNSINIAKAFKGEKFDAIWVDGDHHNPQVTIDLINSINLLSVGGILCNDDVIKEADHQKDSYISNESHLTLELLEKNGILENKFAIKRTRNSVSNVQKYVSISKLLP